MTDEAPDAIQDQPEADAPTDAVDQANAPVTDMFDDKFDPATLPDELRPVYNQYRADYTRKTQEIGSRNRDQILQQALQDQNFQRQAFEAWGVELPEEDQQYDEGDYVDPEVEELRRDVAEMKAWRAEQMQVHQSQRLANDITEQIEGLEHSLGRTFDKKRSDFFGNLALQYQDEQGRPNVRAAYEDWAEQMSEERKSWASTKRQARPAPSGQSGSKQVNLNNDQERRQALADAFEEAELGD